MPQVSAVTVQQQDQALAETLAIYHSTSHTYTLTTWAGLWSGVGRMIK